MSYGIKIYVKLHKDDMRADITLEYLPRAIKNEISQLKTDSPQTTLDALLTDSEPAEY
ncbi:MAG: hypothetical protein GF311_26375 [Candidatus Lokiarchaeota archaeon]|nr:hypothetical protein [Candidatus Lokiarchaeota archaeon]